MDLDLPIPGLTDGPLWASKVNKALTDLATLKIGDDNLDAKITGVLADPESEAATELSNTILERVASLVPYDESWLEAWTAAKGGNRRRLYDWYANNTGPRYPIDRDNPIVGEVSLSTQADADALAGKLIQGHIIFTASNITLTDFALEVDGAAFPITWTSGVTGVRVMFYEIDGLYDLDTTRGIGGSTFTSSAPGAQLTAMFGRLHRLTDGLHATGGSLLRYNWIYDPIIWPRDVGTEYDPNVDPHCDGIQCTGGSNLEISRNMIDYVASWPNSSNIISCLILNPATQAIDNVTIAENYLEGGNYTIHSITPSGGSYGAPTNVTLDSNLFGGGYVSGLLSYENTPTFTGENLWADTLTPIPETSGALDERVEASRENPLGINYVSTYVGPGTSRTWQSANEGKYLRVLSAGIVARIRLHVTTQSGNISVGVYRGSRGRFGTKPKELIAEKTVACPSTGLANIALDTPVFVQPGDYLALSCDNTTAAFLGFSGSASLLYGGQYLRASGQYPLDDDPSTTSAGGDMPILIGSR